MDRKIVFRLSLVVVLLAAFSLSCKLVSDVSELRGIATDAQGIATDINVQGMATSMQGLATQINAEGVATSMQGLATQIDVQGVATNMQGLATQIDVQGILTAIPSIDVGGIITDITGMTDTGVVATPSGFPTDVPILQGSLSSMKGSPTTLQYTADVEVKDAVDFYRREMAARGWVEAPGSKVTSSEAAMTFKNGSRTARVNIEEDLIMGVVIKIALE